MDKFSKNLKFLISKYDVTQAQLAFWVGKGQNTISNWINEASMPDLKDLRKINQFFGVSLDALSYMDIENSNLITKTHLQEFKAKRNLIGKVIGNVLPVERAYFIDSEGIKSVANEPDPILAYTIAAHFKQVNENIDNLKVLVEKCLNRMDRKV